LKELALTLMQDKIANALGAPATDDKWIYFTTRGVSPTIKANLQKN
jgi:hypothetical protein